MQGYFAIATLLLLMVLVLSRVFLLRRMGIEAMHFGKLDKTDFLIPSICFILFLYYLCQRIRLAKARGRTIWQ